MSRMTYRDAVREGLRDALAGDARVFLMGEDVGKYGGACACSRVLSARWIGLPVGQEQQLLLDTASISVFGCASVR